MRMGKEGLLLGYASTIVESECKQRYADKLMLISGHDPYEIPKKEWQDNIDMASINVRPYLHVFDSLSKSLYTKDDMLNYKAWIAFRTFRMDGRKDK